MKLKDSAALVANPDAGIDRQSPPSPSGRSIGARYESQKLLSPHYFMVMAPTMPASVWPLIVHLRSSRFPVFTGTNHHSAVAPG